MKGKRVSVLTALLVVVLAVAGSSQASATVGAARAAATVAPQGASGGLMGDVNCSGGVDSVDALQVLRLTAGLTTNANCMDTAGDVDCSGDVNSVDALRVLRYVAGLSNQAVSGCTAIGQAMGLPPSSYGLIDQALKDGKIDAETALKFKVFATFGDPRLPAEYKGDDSGLLDSDILSQATADWDKLSTQTQETIAPFLIPPIYEGSWASPAEPAALSQAFPAADAGPSPQACLKGPGIPPDVSQGWSYKETQHFRVWYGPTVEGEQGEAAAGYIAAEIENIWNKETSLMGRSPLDDGSEPCNGGGPKMDIYVNWFSRGLRGQTVAYREADCKLRPAFILVNPRNADNLEDARDLLAHEFFHTISLDYDLLDSCAEYAWLDEATATWMIDYVYPQDNYEHEFKQYLDNGGFHWPIEEASGGNFWSRNGYEDYLYLFYLARQTSPTAIRDIWNYTEVFDSLAALDAGSPGGLLERWPEFSLFNWNRPDIDYYAKWDSLPWKLPDVESKDYGADYRIDVSLEGAGQRDFRLNDIGGLEHLTSRYVHATVNDSSVHRLEFFNAGFQAGDDLGRGKIQAWIKLADGSTRTEDWTGRDKIIFCRNIPSQDVAELMVVWSDSTYLDRNHISIPSGDDKIRAAQAGCSDWKGTAKRTKTESGLGFSGTETTEANVVFRNKNTPGTAVCGDLGHPQGIPCEGYYVASGTVTYNYVGQIGECTLTIGPSTITLPHNPPEAGGDGLLVVYTGADPQTYYGAGGDGTEWMAEEKVQCPTGGYTTSFPAFGTWFKVDPGSPFTVKNKGRLIEGTYTESNGGPNTTWEWHFEPAPPE